MELDLPKTRGGELKEKSLRTTLRNVQAEGHPYVEIREQGKKQGLVLFCILCLAPCNSDSCLFAHLKGRRHTERLATVRLTLLKPNPWPFNDGMLFFHQQTKSVAASDKGKNKSVDVDVGPVASTQSSLKIKGNKKSSRDGEKSDGILVIPNVMQNVKACDLAVRHIGVGRIGARFRERFANSTQLCRIWCEWLGNVDSTTPKHEFYIVTFSYNYNLGRMGLVDGFNYMLPSAPIIQPENIRSHRGMKRKLVSDPTNIRNQDHSSQSSKSSKSKVLYTRDEDRLARIMASKTMRKRLRKQYRLYAEITCHICDKKMVPGKDVVALLNRSTGRLACSSGNPHGIFHMCHISCLIQWILLFDAELVFDDHIRKKIFSAYCPECQATGVIMKGDESENYHADISEIRKYKAKLCAARNAWMKSPEILDNCSIGLHFPQEDYENLPVKETIDQLKILHFYRAIE